MFELEKIGENVKVVEEADKVLKVGLTGSVASGKSTALKFFEHLGACTFSADRCLHNAYESNKSLQDQIVQLFGGNIISMGKINRDKLAQIVFSSPEQLNKLELATHPFVFARMQEAYKESSSPIFAAEIPLLLESSSPFSSWFDITINVHRARDAAKTSFLSSGKTEREFEARMSRFLPDEERQNQCTYTLNNFGRLDELESAVRNLMQQLKIV